MLLAQSSVTKLQSRPVCRASGELECTPPENQNVDAAIGAKAIEFQRLHIVAFGRGLNTMFNLDVPSI